MLSERYEAERKRIEAIGIQTFYSIVSESLNDTLLTRRAIEATIDLSRSPNTKVIVVGGNREQMPLILGSDITQQPATPTPLPQVSPQSQPTLPDFDQLPPLFPDQPGQSLSAPSVDADVGLDSAPTRTRADAQSGAAADAHQSRYSLDAQTMQDRAGRSPSDTP